MAVTDEERLVVALEARIRDFEKNMAKAERTGTGNFNKLRQGSRSATQAMERDMVNSTNRVNQALATTAARVGAFGKAFAGGLAVGAVAATLEGARRAVEASTKSVLELADSAKVAGVSFNGFQRLKFVAEQNRVPIDALTDGLKELNLRADEFVQTGKGSGAEAFQRLGYTAEDLAKKLKEPEKLFLEIIGRLGQLDKAAQIRIADEVFGGTGGERFVQLIDQGEDGLRRQIQLVEDLGGIMDENMVQKAEEANRAFNVLSTTIGTHLRTAIVNAVGAWFTFLDSYREFQDQQSDTLKFRQAQLGMNRVELENQMLQIPKTEEMTRRKIQAQLDAIANEEAVIVSELNKRLQRTKAALPPEVVLPPSGAAVPPTSGSGKVDLLRYLAAGKDASHISGMSSSFESKLEKMLAALPKELAGAITINSGYRSNERQAQLWQEALAKYGSVAEARKWVAPPGNSQHNKGNAADLGYANDAARQWAHQNASQFGLSFPLSNENWHIEDAGARSGAMAERTKELEQAGQAYDDLIARGREFIAQQGTEGQALNMTEQAANALRYEQELLNSARQAGIDLSPAQIDSIRQLAGEMASAEEQTRRLAESQEQARQAAQEFASIAQGITKGFVSDLMNGASAADALKNALGRVADVMLDQVLNSIFQVKGAAGGGGGGGIFGGLFGGLFGGGGGLLGSLFSFDGGGHTGAGARSGGVDGKGGFPAILHPNETVIDHTKQRSGSSQSASSSTSSVKVDSEIVVRMDDEGKLTAIVERTAAKAADKRVKSYDANLPGRMDAINRAPRKRVNKT